MAKSNSILNKKFLKIMIVLIVLAGLAVGLYEIFKPRTNLIEPYNNTFYLTTNTDLQKVKTYHTKLEGWLNDCYTEITDEQAISNKINKEEINFNIDMYKSIDNVYSSFDIVNEKLINNIAFCKDNNGKMLKPQQKLSNQYKTVLSKLSTCVEHIENYFVDHKVKDVEKPQLYRKICNYNTFYFDCLAELGHFYHYASDIFENFVIENFNVNPITKKAVKTASIWSEELLVSIKNNDKLIQENVENSSLSLLNFTTKKVNENLNYYNNKDSYDVLLSNFNKASFDDCVKALASNTYNALIENTKDNAETQNAIKTLGKDFFLVVV